MPISPSVARRMVINAGLNPDEYDLSPDGSAYVRKTAAQPVISDNGTPQPKLTQPLGAGSTFVKEAIHSAPATLMGGAGAVLGGAAGGALVSGPFAPVGALVGGIAGAMGLGMGTSYLQNKIEEKVVPDYVQELSAAREAHPLAAFGGRLAAMPLGGMNANMFNVGKAAGTTAEIAKRAMLERSMRAALAQTKPSDLANLGNVGIGAGLGTGMAVGGQMAQGKGLGESLTSLDTLEGLLGGAVFNKPNAIGRRMGFTDVADSEMQHALAAARELRANAEAAAPAKVEGFTPEQLAQAEAAKKGLYEKKEGKPASLDKTDILTANQAAEQRGINPAKAAEMEAQRVAQAGLLTPEQIYQQKVQKELQRLQSLRRQADFEKATLELQQQQQNAQAEIAAAQAEIAAAQAAKAQAKSRQQLQMKLGVQATPEAIAGRALAAPENRPATPRGNNKRVAKMQEELVDPLQDEADIIQERLERKNQDPEEALAPMTDTELAQQVRAKGANVPVDDFVRTVFDAQAKTRGADVSPTDEPGSYALVSDQLKRMAAKIGTKEGSDTRAHEAIGHIFIRMLKLSPYKSDQQLYKQALTLAENSPELKAIQAKQKEAGAKVWDAEEFIANQQGLEWLMADPAVRGETANRKWFNDFKVKMKSLMGNANAADVRRLINYKWHNDAAFETYFGKSIAEGAAGVGTRVEQGDSESVKAKLAQVRGEIQKYIDRHQNVPDELIAERSRLRDIVDGVPRISAKEIRERFEIAHVKAGTSKYGGHKPEDVLWYLKANLKDALTPAQLDSAKTVDDLARILGYTLMHQTGETVSYNPLMHEDMVGGLVPGDKVTVTRPGYVDSKTGRSAGRAEVKPAGVERVNQDPRESMSPDEGFNSKEGDDILSSNEDIEVNDALPAKLPPPPAGYRRVKVVKPDGGSYEAFFNDKYYDMGEMGKFASIAKMTDGGLTHGATAKGETIQELPSQLYRRDQNPEEAMQPSKKLKDMSLVELAKLADVRHTQMQQKLAERFNLEMVQERRHQSKISANRDELLRSMPKHLQGTGIIDRGIWYDDQNKGYTRRLNDTSTATHEALHSFLLDNRPLINELGQKLTASDIDFIANAMDYVNYPGLAGAARRYAATVHNAAVQGKNKPLYVTFDDGTKVSPWHLLNEVITQYGSKSFPPESGMKRFMQHFFGPEFERQINRIESNSRYGKARWDGETGKYYQDPSEAMAPKGRTRTKEEQAAQDKARRARYQQELAAIRAAAGVEPVGYRAGAQGAMPEHVGQLGPMPAVNQSAENGLLGGRPNLGKSTKSNVSLDTPLPSGDKLIDIIADPKAVMPGESIADTELQDLQGAGSAKAAKPAKETLEERIARKADEQLARLSAAAPESEAAQVVPKQVQAGEAVHTAELDHSYADMHDIIKQGLKDLADKREDLVAEHTEDSDPVANIDEKIKKQQKMLEWVSKQDPTKRVDLKSIQKVYQDPSEAMSPRERQVNSPEFKRWFGDSKVVDKDGKPLVVYHGTPTGGFNTFEYRNKYRPALAEGFYFGENPRKAESYTQFPEGGFSSPEIKELYLKAENPFKFDSLDKSEIGELVNTINTFMKEAPYELSDQHSHPDKNKLFYRTNARNAASFFFTPNKDGTYTFHLANPTRLGNVMSVQSGTDINMQGLLRKLGYDSATHVLSEHGREWVVFEPTQIKSATGNSGAFDPANPDIRYQNPSEAMQPKDKATFYAETGVVGRGLLHTIASEVDKLKRMSPVAGKAAETFLAKLRARRGELEGGFNYAIKKVRKAGNLKEYWFQDNDDYRAVVKWRDAMMDKGVEPFALTPIQQKINQVVSDSLKQSLDLRESFKDEGDIEGLARGTKGAPNYLPHVMSREASNVLAEQPTSAAAEKLYKEFMKYRTEVKGQAAAEAEKHWKTIRDSFNQLEEGNIASRFGAIDKAMGKGLPASMREQNLMDRMGRFNRRFARRVAYHEAIQRNPEAHDLLFNSNKGLASTRVGKNVLQDMFGIREHQEATRSALSGVVRAAMLGPLTGAKDVVAGQVLGFQHMGLSQVLPAKMAALRDWSKSYERAIKTGIVREGYGGLESGEGGLKNVQAVLMRSRDVINQVQGRQLLETASRVLNYGEGRYLVLDAFNAIRAGRLDGTKRGFLDDFVPDWQKYKKGEVPTEVIDEAAAKYVESVQGTYDYRGLPEVAMKGTLSPYLSLARWNIEKFNNFTKQVVQPATKGNYKPLLMATLGAFIGGTAVNALVAEVTGRKERTANWDEIANSKEQTGLIAYKLAALASLAGYSGMLGDLVKSGFDARYKNRVQSFSNPLVDAGGTILEDGKFLVQALQEGDMPAITDVLHLLASDFIQAYRVAIPHLSEEKQKELEDANNRRDLKVWKMGEGMPLADSTLTRPNPLINKDMRQFKETTDVAEAAGLLPALIDKAIKKATDENGMINPEILKAELSRYKRNSYQTVPSPERNPMAAGQYMNWLSKTQGADVASRRIEDYVRRNAINRAKSSMVPNL